MKNIFYSTTKLLIKAVLGIIAFILLYLIGAVTLSCIPYIFFSDLCFVFTSVAQQNHFEGSREDVRCWKFNCCCEFKKIISYQFVSYQIVTYLCGTYIDNLWKHLLYLAK
jgi:hypothetical protein